MARSLLLVVGLVGYSAAAAVSVAPEANLFRRDPVPNKLGQCATYADLKWQPGEWFTSVTKVPPAF